jgi:hypothetical protein
MDDMQCATEDVDVSLPEGEPGIRNELGCCVQDGTFSQTMQEKLFSQRG